MLALTARAVEGRRAVCARGSLPPTTPALPLPFLEARCFTQCARPPCLPAQVPKRTGRGVASLRASATTRPSHSPERTTGSLRMQRTAPGATAASGPPAFLPPISKGSAQRAPATKAAATLLDAAAGGEAAQGQTLGWGQGPVTSAGYQVRSSARQQQSRARGT